MGEKQRQSVSTQLKRQKYIAKYFSVDEALEHLVSKGDIIQKSNQSHRFRQKVIIKKLGMSTWKNSVIAKTFCYFCRFMVNKINLERNFGTFKDVINSADCFKEFVKIFIIEQHQMYISNKNFVSKIKNKQEEAGIDRRFGHLRVRGTDRA